MQVQYQYYFLGILKPKSNMKNYKNQFIAGGVFLLAAVIFGLVNECKAQDKSTVKGDTLEYNGYKFYKGKVITFGYGSGTNKAFAFIWQGSGFAVSGNAPSSYNKMEAEVVKFQKGGGKNYIKAKMITLPSSVTIDIEGAIDNGEINP